MRKIVRILVFILVMSLPPVAYRMLAGSNHPIGADFPCYYIAAKTLINHQSLYAEFHGHSGILSGLDASQKELWHKSGITIPDNSYPFMYGYPPLFLALILPIVKLKYHLALGLWMGFLVTLLLLSTRHLACSMRREFNLNDNAYMLFWGMLWLNNGAQAAINSANASAILMALNCLALASILNSRKSLTGAFLAIGAAIKLTPILQLLAFVDKYSRSVVLWFIIVISACALGSLLVGGINNNIAFVDYVAPAFERGSPINSNWSLSALVVRLLEPHTTQSISGIQILVHLLTMLMLIITIASFFWNANSKSINARLAYFSALSCIVVLISPIAWPHHYSLAIPGAVTTLFLVVSQSGGRKRVMKLFTIVIGYMLISAPRILLPLEYNNRFLGTERIVGTLIIWSAACYILWTSAKPRQSNSHCSL